MQTTQSKSPFSPIHLISVSILFDIVILRIFLRLQHPSEAVSPVALGKARAKQFSLLKTSPEDCKLGDKVMCVQLHGDGSFTGQGVVMETLGLSKYRFSFVIA